jgi:hypothetical protein
MLKRDCRGTHIGVVLSFMIFIIFLAFLYSALAPTVKIEEGKKFILESLEVALVESINTNLTTLTVTVPLEAGACVVLGEIIADAGITSRIIVKDESKETASSYISETDSDDLIVQRDSSGDNFLKIYSSPEFDFLEEGATSGCEERSDYEIDLLKKSEYISEKKIFEKIGSYESDYGGLKEELGFSENSNFGFGFVFSNGTLFETLETNSSESVYAKEIPVRYINKNAEILSGSLKIKVW